jgi:glycerol-1-phosphate dehydrogenase [NAD(P)+]
VALVMDQLSEQAEYLVAVGSGTVHDITRYCAWLRGIPFVSCPTAASVDGFCSSVAAMTWEGAKKTLTAVAPRLVVADLNVISQAPAYLARSGFGDMIGKYVALTEWRIAHLLTGEFYCDRIARITEEATRAVLDSAAGIAAGEAEAYEKLTYGLVLSGLAMQLMGNSRPASGAEHHISHIIEMAPDSYHVCSDALHGEKVGVGTLLAIEEYHRLAKLPASAWGDYRAISESEIFAVFGARLSRQICEENARDAAADVKGARIRDRLPAVQEVIKSIPTADELRQVYDRLGVMQSLEEIGVTQQLYDKLLDHSPMVRNRLTLMRLRRCIQ